MTIFVMFIIVIMQKLGILISDWRKKNNRTMQSLSANSGIDQALLSKYESGKRLPSDRHLLALSAAMDTPYQTLKNELLADKIYNLVKYEDQPSEILILAEGRVEYLSSKKASNLPNLSENVLAKIAEADELKNKWANAKPLNIAQLVKLKEYFDTNYTFDSNRIEGNTLTLQETHLVINEGITISGKSMKEHLEAINHAEAIAWIRDLSRGLESINKRSVLDIHRLVLKSIDNENAGKYRKVGVRISGSEHVPPDALKLDELMDDFFAFYTLNKNRLHPIILAAEMHERLVSIHPFIDGNGRTARLIMNFILIKSGYTLAILKGDVQSRLAYYKTLESVQVDNNPEPFYLLILEKEIESLKEHLSMV